MINYLQVISGKYKGKRLEMPDSARPTQNKSRLAIFNILASQHKMEEFAVWDAFAGSGAMGIEFISRFGAKYALFTDIDLSAISAIQKNTKNISDCKVTINQIDANKFAIKNLVQDDPLVIFIDPPYSTPELGIKLVEQIGKISTVKTIIVWEMENGFNFDMQKLSCFSIIKDRIYGRARFIIMEK